MNISAPRSLSFDAPSSPQAAAVDAHVRQAEESARHRPQPVEAVEPEKRIRREQPGIAARRIAADNFGRSPQVVSAAEFFVAAPDMAPPRRGPYGWIGLDSTPFLAQLAGQNAVARDPVAAGRSPTSFRHSPVDRYEEVQGWGRRIELMFVFDGMITAAAA